MTWSTGSSLLSSKPNVNINKSVETEVIDLANFINNIDKKIKILKVDIEGMECDLLNHLIETNAINNIELVLVETHDHKIPELIEPTLQLRKKILISFQKPWIL